MLQPLARFAVSLVIAGAWVAAPTGAAAEPVPGTNCAMFPPDSVFAADISTLPFNAQSATWMSNMTQNANLHPDLGTFAQWYGIPINVAPPPSSGVTPTFAYDSESDHPPEAYPIDQNTWIEGGPGASSGSDRHALVVDANRCKLYEIYNLQNFTNGQTPQAGSGAVWDLNSDAMRPAGWTSADAAGLPIAPLLLRPDEILAGSIAHAIRFTAHCTNAAYIWPASHQAGVNNSGCPPMGARFRLRSSFDISGFNASTQVVLRAFQHYGLVLADNGSDWFFQGKTDDWWGTTAGSTVVSELKTIPASQFDAVDESSLQVAPGSYRAVPTANSWSSLSGILISGPGASAWSASRSDVFAVGGDRGLWQDTWNGTAWAGWSPLGGIVSGDPGAVSWASGRIDVLVRGSDGALYHRYSDGSQWSGWEGLGGGLSYGPAVASWGVQRLDIFITGQDRQLWHKYWDGQRWGGWEALGGVLTSKPAAVSWGPGQLAVLARGQDGQMWQLAWASNHWTGWQPLGGQFSSGPGLASCASGHLDAYALGLDRALWHQSWNGSTWSGWQSLGGYWTSAPGAVCLPGTTNVNLFELGPDSAVWHSNLQGT